MALLIGPVDYLVLKRIDRLPWTYLSFMAILAVFTVGAYFGVEFLRAGENQVRRISIVDKIDGSSHIWQTGYTGIFASRSDDYLVTGFSPESWWSGITPAEEYGYYGRQNIKSTIECFQQEGNIPVSLPVNIWSMRTLMDEQRGTGFPLTAKISLEGENLSAHLRNTGSLPVASGAIWVKDHWWEFGRIEPGQRITVTGRPVSSIPGWGKDDNGKYNYYNYMSSDGRTIQPWRILLAPGTSLRTRGIEDYHHDGAAIVYAMTENTASCPLAIKGKKVKVNHIAYYRLVIPGVQTGSKK